MSALTLLLLYLTFYIGCSTADYDIDSIENENEAFNIEQQYKRSFLNRQQAQAHLRAAIPLQKVKMYLHDEGEQFVCIMLPYQQSNNKPASAFDYIKNIFKKITETAKAIWHRTKQTANDLHGDTPDDVDEDDGNDVFDDDGENYVALKAKKPEKKKAKDNRKKRARIDGPA